MAVKKKAAKKTTRSISSIATSEAMSSEMTTDTKTIVVVLLLLFLYPIGVIFMWIWMKTWPAWAKILISIPFVFGILVFIFGFTMVGWIIRNGRYHKPMYKMQQEREIPQMSGNTNNQYYLSPTPYSTGY